MFLYAYTPRICRLDRQYTNTELYMGFRYMNIQSRDATTVHIILKGLKHDCKLHGKHISQI
uniref:Uncharacterized protein n=1 Tax=Arundo donax TaxID=35708 RepID=A0A0A9H6M5_ARUDO